MTSGFLNGNPEGLGGGWLGGMGRWGDGERGRRGDDFDEPSAFCLLPSASCLSWGDGKKN
ncbi:MAG: hypothetical protein F6K58_27280 [Symploca sp. SIO2E9]|nr:hypothetical protein [Symploca sp. SIO2E9]